MPKNYINNNSLKNELLVILSHLQCIEETITWLDKFGTNLV